MVKIAAIVYKFGRNRPHEIFDILTDISREGPDITIAPDYALNLYIDRPNSLRERNRIIREIERKIKNRNGIVIPGTMSYKQDNQCMVHVAPLFIDGYFDKEFLKERDNSEGELAQRAGLTYLRGNNSNNFLYAFGEKIAVEICGDHGNQDVRGCDIELILALDKNAGFSPRPPFDSFSRKAIICDSYQCLIEAFNYDISRSPKTILIKGEERERFKVFKI